MRARLTILLATVLITGAGCSTGSSPSGTSTPPASSGTTSAPVTTPTHAPTTSSPPATSSAPAQSAAQQLLAKMSLEQRVGQLLMVDCPSTQLSSQTVSAIQDLHVGSVILDNTSYDGQDAIAQLTGELEDSNPSAAKLFIATDQEGGQVQRLQGPGFTTIPSAVDQGRIAPDTLRGIWTGLGGELSRAGINVDLAPVLDTVPSDFGSNPPIGDLDRQYGSIAASVTSHGLAAAAGLTAAGVVPTVKHFPGLGRVHGNTDDTSGVTDTITSTSDSKYLAPFAAAVKARVPFVMVSTAIYSQLDPKNPAAFSKTIIGGILRKQLGFTGVVISDDVGKAQQVAYLSPGERAVDFVAAGGDIVLTVDPDTNAPMANALLDKAKTDPAFRKLVDAAALRVLTAKQRYGLLGQ